ncbi:MAG: methionyl-tRNA formyltransferase [Nanoarchaeota archaeon]|nr:methionyl-tRNA formyltransferase [Nanoarchaeota archaeon]
MKKVKPPSIIIATIKSWNINNFYKLKEIEKDYNWILIEKKEDLKYDLINKINPKYIFFPHWSWIIPEEIYKNLECIVFHMTDLPFGRGGSPLQNLIARGIYETKISAIKVVGELDAGDVYYKEPLSLKNGKAEDIFKKASAIIFDKMIPSIINKNIIPKKQTGEVVIFKRRTPEQSNMSNLNDLNQVYNYIRMLDAEGYLRAFLETDNLRIEFNNAQISNDDIQANCIIKLKNGKK